MSASEKNIKRAIEVCDLMKELRNSQHAIVLIRDHVFDAVNVPFKAVRKAHQHLIDAENSIAAAATALTKS